MEWGCGWGAGESELDCRRVAAWSAWGHGVERLEVGVGMGVKWGWGGGLRRKSLGVWVKHLGSGNGATVRLQLGRLGVVGSLFIGEFKTLRLGLKYWTRKAESFKRSVILVAQGFLKRGTSWVDGLVLHLAG